MNAAISHNGLFVGGIGFVVDDVAEETLCPLEAENFAEDPQVDNRPLYESVREKKHLRAPPRLPVQPWL